MSDACVPGFLARLPVPPRCVALLRASRIGDFLCAIPAIRALRSALPEAEIAMITLPLLREVASRSLQPGPHRVVAHAVSCRPCTYTICPIGYPCLERVSVPQVVAAADGLLAERKVQVV